MTYPPESLRRLALSFVTVGLSAVLSGCGGSKQETADSSRPSSPASAAESGQETAGRAQRSHSPGDATRDEGGAADQDAGSTMSASGATTGSESTTASAAVPEGYAMVDGKATPILDAGVEIGLQNPKGDTYGSLKVALQSPQEIRIFPKVEDGPYLATSTQGEIFVFAADGSTVGPLRGEPNPSKRYLAYRLPMPMNPPLRVQLSLQIEGAEAVNQEVRLEGVQPTFTD